MSGAYLPVTREVRDRANAYLAGMAARGFVPVPMEEVVRVASTPRCPHDAPLSGRCVECQREHAEATR